MKKLVCYTLLLLQLAACQTKTKEETTSAEEPSVNFDVPVGTQTATEAVPPQAPPKQQEYVDERFTIKDNDTLVISNYQLIFSPASRINFPAYYADQKERDRVATGKDLYNSFLKAKAVESYLKEKHGNLFTKVGSVLTLQLANGQTLRFPEWEGEGDETIGYHLEHYFPEQDYFLLRVQYYEGNGWMLVNRKNGSKKHLSGRPYFSPDGTAVITANVEFEAYNYNGIEYYKVQADTLAEGWSLELKDWGPGNIKWLNNSDVLISKSEWSPEAKKIIEGESILKLKLEEK